MNLASISINLIRANQADTGAYVASPTFPTYQYCWFRDGTYIAYAMSLVGQHESAKRFYDWAALMVNQRADVVERAIMAAPNRRPMPAELLDTRYTLDGAAGADDWPNFQLDGFGTLLWGMNAYIQQQQGSLPPAWRTATLLLARYLDALWQLPCYDCWEEFGDKIHTATLAALYGGFQSAARLLQDDTYETTAAQIKAFVLHNNVVGTTLNKFVGNMAVDASLIHVAVPYGLLEPNDPLMQATVARIESDLCRPGGGVHRYVEDSYYGGGEWLLLTAYLGWYYVEAGDVARAHELCNWVEAQADTQGHMPEQVAVHLNYPDKLVEWNQRWGTSANPLLWSHAAYLTLRTLLNL